MANKQRTNRDNRSGGRPTAQPTAFEEARDELFQHVMQCGVIGAEPVDQKEWFDATMAYMTDRFPELTPDKLLELRTLGERFAQPPKRRTEASAASAA